MSQQYALRALIWKRNTLVYYLEGHSSSEGATGLLNVDALLKCNLDRFNGKF